MWNGAATGVRGGIIWLMALLGLPVFACAVSLIASGTICDLRTVSQ